MIDYERYSQFLKAMGHPVRLKIIEGLLKGEDCNVTKIVRTVGVPQSTVSQHLTVLKNQGIIAFYKQGVKTCYRVVDSRARLILAIVRNKKGADHVLEK